MRFTNPTLDRVWLWMVAISFIIGIPIWLLLSIDRMGWRFVVIALYLAGASWWMRR